MATLAYLEPAIYMAGQEKEPDSQPYPVTGGTTLLRGDFATITSGLLTKPVTNVATGANIVGLCEHDSRAVYFSGLGGSTAELTPGAAGQSILGATTATTILQPGFEINGVKVILAHGSQQFEISLVQAWAVALLGTQAALGLDATTGFFVADNSLSHATALNIVGKVDGPNKGVIGDVGARIIVTFNPTFLAF